MGFNTRKNSNMQKESFKEMSFDIFKETSLPLKQIFNSSLKRINKELANIKEKNA
jgi:hypothetical protein